MRLINLNKLHTEVLYNIKRPILTGYFPARASVPVHTTLAIKYIFLAVLASEIKQKEVLTLCCTFCVFSSRSFIIRTCATVRWASLHSSPSLFFFSLSAPYTSNATLFQRPRHMCIFPHSWIPDFQFGGNHLHVQKTEGQRLERVRREESLIVSEHGRRFNCAKPVTAEEKNTGFKEHTEKVSPKECSPSPFGIIIIWL